MQVFLHSCNTTAIEEVESGALEEFGGFQKKLEILEWLTLTLVWVERPAQKEDGRQKSDGNGFGASQSVGGGGGCAIFNHGIDPHLRIIDNLGDMTFMARSENLRIPLAEDGSDICLRFSSKGDCVRSCKRSHAPLRGHNRNLVIRYIRGAREAMNQFHKRKYDGGGEQETRWGTLGQRRKSRPSELGGTA